MTALRAMWLSRDSNDDGTTPRGARLAVGGFLAHGGDSALDVRPGVFWDGAGSVVAGKSDMTYDVRAFVAVIVDGLTNGPLIVPNDDTVNVATTAAPGSGSRIDVVWVQQKLTADDGGSESTNGVTIGVTQGTASGSPSAPSIPDDALALAQVTVPNGTVGTDELVIERAHPWTAAAGGVVVVADDTERDEITLEGAIVYNQAAEQHQALVDSEWKPVGGASTVLKRVMRTGSNQSVSNSATDTLTTWETYSANTDDGTLFTHSSGVLTCVTPGHYRIDAQVSVAGGGSGEWDLLLIYTPIGGGGEQTPKRSQVDQQSSFQTGSLFADLALVAGDKIEIRVANSTGGTRSVYGGSQDRGLWSVRYDGPAA